MDLLLAFVRWVLWHEQFLRRENGIRLGGTPMPVSIRDLDKG